MNLVDTSIWVDHLRTGDPHLAHLLNQGMVSIHSFVLGEIACGSLHDRSDISLLSDLPAAIVASEPEILAFIERHSLYGRGIGYVDVNLLASAMLSPGTRLWTRDERLAATASQLRLEYQPPPAH